MAFNSGSAASSLVFASTPRLVAQDTTDTYQLENLTAWSGLFQHLFSLIIEPALLRLPFEFASDLSFSQFRSPQPV